MTIIKRGDDYAFAINPHSWRNLVDCSYELLSALGEEEKIVEENEA